MTESKADLLIKNGTIITMDPDKSIINNGVVAILNDNIEGIGSEEEMSSFQAEKEVDAKGCLVMPGLVNTHTHAPMSLFRGLADDLELMTWLNEYMFPAEAKYITADTVKAGTLLSCAEMLLGGITTIGEGYFHEDGVAEAFLTTGMRGILGHGVIDYPAPGVPDPKENVRIALLYAEKWLGRSSLLQPSIFCHSPYTCSADTLKNAKTAANEKGLLFQIHAAETKFEWDQIHQEHGVSPIQYLDRLGLLDEKTLLVHTVWIDEKDITTILNRKAAVSHNPESNMKLASGISPIPDMIEAGITVGLGTDGSASNNDLDLFSEMDTAAKLHKVKSLDSTVMDAGSVLSMATIEGAKALGLEDFTGSLETGKQADMIIIDMKKPHLVPMYNPVSHLVYAVKSTDVKNVFVAEKMLVKDRKLQTLDLEEIIRSVEAIQQQIME